MMFEGIPTWPNPDRYWQIIEKWQVNQFYTAPTAIRAIAAAGEEWPAKYEMPSLRLLGTVGEPINPEAWRWYHRNAGKERCPIVDTWWQTETGGILITPLPGATALKPGSATFPFFGIEPVVLDPEKGTPIDGDGISGVLAMKAPWPGQMRTVYGDHRRFEEIYFQQYKGYYFTGDGCRRDEDGYYWITGRVDDVINVSGHRMGTAEVESALVLHGQVAEAAVVGFPHEVKGQGIYAYVTLNTGEEYTEELKDELKKQVRAVIGPHRPARRDPLGSGPAQDALRQDHAPHPAQDRRERHGQHRRHQHPGRPGGGRRPDRPALIPCTTCSSPGAVSSTAPAPRRAPPTWRSRTAASPPSAIWAGAAAGARVDAAGRFVAPGFIDIHTHSDLTLLVEGRASSSVAQGITTQVVGNCGVSAAPTRDYEPYYGPLDPAMTRGLECDWTGFDGYFARLEDQGIGTNVAALVGHGNLRVGGHGLGRPRGDAGGAGAHAGADGPGHGGRRRRPLQRPGLRPRAIRTA